MEKLCTMLCLLFLLPGCAKKKNIEGTYIRTFQNKYAFGTDTLTVERIGRDNIFMINKSSGYRRIEKGIVTGQPEYGHAKWLAMFDEQNNELINDFERKIIRLNVDGETLLLGKSIYRKVGK